MHFLYIIYSDKMGRFYIGESENSNLRLSQHNQHYFNSSFTNGASDWELILTFECKTKCEALYLEQYIKRMKSSAFIEKVIKEPTILKDILNKK